MPLYKLRDNTFEITVTIINAFTPKQILPAGVKQVTT